MTRDMEDLLLRIYERSWSTSSGCLVYLGAPSQEYGRISFEGKKRRVHVLMYEILVGPVPENHDLDHICQEPRCWLPSHLQPLTRQEHIRVTNQRMGLELHCRNGHPRVEGKQCRACNKAAQERMRARQLAEMSHS